MSIVNARLANVLLAGFSAVSLAACAPVPSIATDGGVVLIYDVEASVEKNPSSEAMQRSADVLRKRLDPSRSNGILVEVVGKTFKITLPKVSDAELQIAKQQISRTGTLEFAIVANRLDHASLIQAAEKLTLDESIVRDDGRVLASWNDFNDDDRFDKQSQIAERRIEHPNSASRQLLLVRDPENQRVTGSHLSNVGVDIDGSGNNCIRIKLNEQGGGLLMRLTQRNLPRLDGTRRRLAIVLDGEIQSAPSIMSPVGAQCQITSKFTDAEINHIVAVLNAGVLDVSIVPTPVQETTYDRPSRD